MLNDPKCMKNMLIEAGYVKIPGFRRLSSYTALNDYLLEYFPLVTRALVMTVIGNASKKRICAVKRHPDPEGGFIAMDTRTEKRDIIALWLHFQEAGLPEPTPDIPKMKQDRDLPSHRSYLYYQPNPLKNNIGDCVIRAYSAVFNQSWEDTLDMLAQSCDYSDTTLNSRTVYRSLTSEYEFDPHSPLKEAGKGLTGREFCDRMTLMCRNGERFFADMGRTHVVGIIPTVIDGVKQYAIADSWDSSSRRIGMYWVYRPNQKPKEKSVAPVVNALESLDIGNTLIHPVFGKGTVLEQLSAEKRVVIRFPQHGDKTMACSWVLTNCRKEAPT